MVASRDFLKEAQQQSHAEGARREWVRLRIEAIHAKVTAYDVLRRHGVDLSSDDHSEQFACPFHGRDNKPSAKVYPEDNRKPSHAWCYVCQERWDVFSLWKKFGAADRPFTAILAEIEREYGLETPEMPEGGFYRGPQVNAALAVFDSLYEACESRLRMARVNYEEQEDMMGYLTACSVLDRIRHRVDTGKVKPEKATNVLEQLRDRIGDRIRA